MVVCALAPGVTILVQGSLTRLLLSNRQLPLGAVLSAQARGCLSKLGKARARPQVHTPFPGALCWATAELRSLYPGHTTRERGLLTIDIVYFLCGNQGTVAT